MSKDKNIITYLDALEKMQSFCAYRERCQQEVLEKLKTYQLEEDQEFYIIRKLIENNFLNEERYAFAFVSGKFSIKRWGKQKIKQHLKQKKITTKLIDRALDSIDREEYLKVLMELYLKKKTTYKDKEYIAKQKTIQYLISRGYTYSDIQLVIEDLGCD